jgi:DNA repair exonuclease SbcCD nuclease subunit
MSMKLLFRTDVHVSDTSPASWKGDYPSEVWDCLEQIGRLAKHHKCKAVLDGGDYFHVKSATRNSHAMVRKTALIHQEYPCDTYSIEGNHDIVGNNLDTLERQPLGVLFATGVFHEMRDITLEEEGVKVRVVGLPYDPERSLDSFHIQKGDEDWLVIVAHCLATENPAPGLDEFFREGVFRYSDLIVPGGADVFCFGHWHKDQGVRTIQGKHFVNLGSVSRGSLRQENLNRTPKVALLEFSKEAEVTPIELNVAPPEDVYDLERKSREQREDQVIEQYVATLKAQIQMDTSTSVESVVEGLNFESSVKKLALEYLERARNA